MRNGSVDARLPAEAAALARCIRDAHGDGAAAHLQDGRLSPRVWHQCVAVACGLEVTKHFCETDVLGHVQRTAPVLEELLHDWKERLACVREARSLGMFGAVDLVEVRGPNVGNRFADFQGNVLSESGRKVPEFKRRLLEEGVIAFFRNCLLHAAPPLISTEPELRDAFARVERALQVFE